MIGSAYLDKMKLIVLIFTTVRIILEKNAINFYLIFQIVLPNCYIFYIIVSKFILLSDNELNHGSYKDSG